ncbi:MAG: hypothetical protein ING29_11385 [Azospirillum sp.]|nr:hypothetical protein [Azospirillum sp.]
MAGSVFGGGQFAGMAGAPQAMQMAYMRDPRLRLAQQLALQGADTSPVQSPWQGAARLAQALMGGWQSSRVNDEYAKQAEQYQNDMRALYAPVQELQAGASGAGPRPDAQMTTRPANLQEMTARLRDLQSPYALQEARGIQQLALQQQAEDMREGRRSAAEQAKFDRELAARREDQQAQRQFQADQAAQARALQESLARLSTNTALQAAQIRAGNRSDPLVEVNDPNSPTGIKLVPQSQAAGMAAPAPRGTTAPTATISPEDQRSLAQQLGVPVLPVDPAATLSPGAAATFAREQQKQTERQLAEEREAVAAGRAPLARLSRFEQLQNLQGTGGILGVPYLGAAARAVAAPFDPQLREMSSIADEITPTMRQPGSGATSDFDARMFQNATVGIDKPAETNRAIIAAARAAQQNRADRLSFMEAYATANRGSLRGAEEQWQRYLEANPIFDPTKENTPTLNPNRRSWADFFRGGGQAQPAQQGGGLTPEEQAELQQLRARFGR